MSTPQAKSPPKSPAKKPAQGKDAKKTVSKPSKDTLTDLPKSAGSARTSSRSSHSSMTTVKSVGMMLGIMHKFKGKKRDGTPDKNASPNPSQDLLDENLNQSKNVLYDEEIEKLAIKEEDLVKVREPKPPRSGRSPVTNLVTVRKMKPASEWDLPKPKTVKVLRQAPPDAPVKPIDISGAAGPRFDMDGNIIPHSILGSVDDYKKRAVKDGVQQDITLPEGYEAESKQPTVKYERKRKFPPSYMTGIQFDESNALKNWQAKMLERKKQQGHISKLLQKPAETLVMNRVDGFRKIQEERYLIDRTIPLVDYGKGYRVGSEFWKQKERIGDDLTGIHTTLTQTEAGFPPPIEHIDVPKYVKEEKGIDFEKPSTPNYPWDKAKSWRNSEFLKQRVNQLRPYMNELDPFKPIMDDLEVIGTNNPYAEENKENDPHPEIESDRGLTEIGDEENEDPLKDYPDVYPTPVFGPSIQFAGQAARWTGDSHSFAGELGIEARVTFEAFADKRVTSFLEIVNDGTTAMYYDWQKIPKSNPFDVPNPKAQRFYFNTSSGVILPGDAMRFPFIFKSPNAGVFTEQWKFMTKPVVCGGAALVVTLRGVALQEDKFKKQRTEIEQELAQKQAVQVVGQILDGLIDGIRTPERSRSPIDAYITESETFERKNRGLHFQHHHIKDLKALYLEFFPEEEHSWREWDYSVETIKDMAMELEEDNEKKEEFLQRLNIAVVGLSFPPFSPRQEKMHKCGYQLLIDALDNMVGTSMIIRSTMGLPDKEDDLDDRSDRRGKDKKGKVDPKAAKETKSKGKEPPKGTPGKGSKTPAAVKPAPSRGPVTTPLGKSELLTDRPGTPGSGLGSPIPDEDNTLENKYKETLYSQTYNLLATAIDHMAQVFDEIQKTEDQQRMAMLMH
ncbi:MYCBP-associated protein-like isoform X2 [Lineus longissimus]|uniref:MYCBP-associated protein-like isoform X2 n=1 Tax=Lineus longissimus TaxID=88925 RepID=UPI00315D9AEB